MTSRIVLQATNVVKELGQGAGLVRALKGVNVTLNAGELTLMMGPSGSGKTTLLSILGCILSPTSGEVVIDGERVDGLSAERLALIRRRYIGFVFQSYNLFPTLTALENVLLALDVRGVRSSEAKARSLSALGKVGLSHRLKSHPSNMSGGEKQRVAIARALASEPSVILADEPTAALDSENGHAVMALLAEIAKGQEHAVLAVTHDPRTLAYADRIIHIEDGLIVSEERRDKTTTSDDVIPENAHVPENTHVAPEKECKADA
jgi:putative ABC transport system ATP-binding protein